MQNQFADINRLDGSSNRVVLAPAFDQYAPVSYEIDARTQVFDQGFGVIRTSQEQIDLTSLGEVSPPSGWRVYNFEVGDHHTYVADGIRVHNKSTTYTLDEYGRLATLTGPNGEDIAIDGNWTPGQAYHYGHVVNVDNGDDTTKPTLTSGGFLEGLSDFAGSFADLIGLDGRFGFQGTFAGHAPALPGESFHEEGQPTPYRVDWSGDQNDDETPDWRDEKYSNIGHWGGDRDDDGVPNHSDYNDGVGWRDNNEGGEGNTEGSGKPIILDMDGDGIEIVANRSVSFDMDADGFREQTSWVSPDDAFLVIDLNPDGSRGSGDGKIEFTHELAFTEWLPTGGVTDLQALSMFDTISGLGGNGDGFLSPIINNDASTGDTVWSELRVWQDSNSNGVADAGELSTLSSLGFTQINLIYDDQTAYDDNSNDVSVFGSTLLGTASFTRNGEIVQGGVGDVALGYNTQGWRKVDNGNGYTIKFESGESYHYAVLADSGSADIDLDANSLDGATGDGRNNHLNASGHSRSVQISGGDGNDSVWGGNNDDLLSGDSGTDDIRGRGGNDLLFVDANDLANGNVSGDEGIDTIFVTGSGGVIASLSGLEVEAAHGGDGNDALSGAGMTYNLILSGGAGNDSLTGGAAGDNISGDDGNDNINGGNGDDILRGGSGHDTINGSNSDDMLLGGEQGDLLIGSVGDDRLLGGKGRDTLEGGDHDDLLNGGGDNDALNGGYGDDTLMGETGNDTLSFWVGDDVLIGGTGDDVFKLNNDGQTGTVPFWGWSIIQGGIGDDTLDLGIGSASDLVQIGNSSNQWQFVKELSSSQKIVVDIIDVEKVIFSGSEMTLSTDTNLDTSDTYIRQNPNYFMGDGNIQTTAPGHHQFLSENVTNTYESSTLKGWTGNDTLNGSIFDDAVSGGQGSDTVEGNAGNDSLYGDEGTDFLNGGLGDDKLVGASGADVLVGGDGQDTLVGGQGADQMGGGAGADSLVGGSGADTLVGGTENDTLLGENGIDALYGDEGNDYLSGGVGGDTLVGGDGSDTLDGGAGSDLAVGGAGSDHLTGGDGADILYGDAQDDTISGGNDDDWLFGGDGNDSLEGDGGRDVIQGGQGADYIRGGGGILDVANYEASNAAVSIDLNVGGMVSGGHAQDDTLLGIEGVYGSGHNDVLTGNDIDNVLEGAHGDDTLRGNEGHDDLHGGDGNDHIYGGSGNDRVWGGQGTDTVDLEDGDDAFFDFMLEDANGNDVVYGGNGNDAINGGSGDDSFNGGSGDDTLKGGDDNDTLDGGQGADELRGGYQIDTVSYGSASAKVLVDLQNSANNINANFTESDARQDTYFNIENIIGSEFNDNLRGDDFSNRIDGRGGNDFLVGRDGADTFVFHGGFSTALTTDQDTILDFTVGTDMIDISTNAHILTWLDLEQNNLSQIGSDARIDDGNGNVLILKNVSKDDLTEDDFIF